MKKHTLLILAFSLLSGFVLSQTAEEAFERYWEGGCQYHSESSSNGLFKVKYTMYNVEYYNVDNTFTATMDIQFQFDGTTYKSTTKVNGDFYPGGNTVTITHDYTISKDELPGMEWKYFTLYLKLLTDADQPGHYVMEGKADGQTGDEFCVLSTYINY
jgi:hypothetical protein